jgi:carbamoyl-phosphate synthase small subunit
MTRRNAALVLADGTVFEGEGFGASGTATGEAVFNTSMFGYQEVLTDPSYVGQIVTMASVHMGNVGTNAFDEESDRPQATGMVVKSYAEASNWRSDRSLDHYLKQHHIIGLSGVDTRALVRHLRTHGSQPAVISDESVSTKALAERARAANLMEGQDLATPSSTVKPYEWHEPTLNIFASERSTLRPPAHHVVAVDYGLKRAMLRYLVDEGCRVTVVPAKTSAQEILALRPDGVFLTNGPGDPAAVVGAQDTVKSLLGKLPIFGICLGHQILSLALGAKTYKMKFGHRGANHPVHELRTGRVSITSQNHGFAVDLDTVKSKAQVTHVNLNDRTVEGLAAPDLQAFSVQYHPEASPGPHDAVGLFRQFTQVLEAAR